jgi:hypothetical protein
MTCWKVVRRGQMYLSSTKTKTIFPPPPPPPSLMTSLPTYLSLDGLLRRLKLIRRLLTIFCIVVVFERIILWRRLISIQKKLFSCVRMCPSVTAEILLFLYFAAKPVKGPNHLLLLFLAIHILFFYIFIFLSILLYLFYSNVLQRCLWKAPTTCCFFALSLLYYIFLIFIFYLFYSLALS